MERNVTMQCEVVDRDGCVVWELSGVELWPNGMIKRAHIDNGAWWLDGTEDGVQCAMAYPHNKWSWNDRELEIQGLHSRVPQRYTGPEFDDDVPF